MDELKYPGWRYHHTKDPVKVNSLAEEDALGDDGWREEPYSDEEKAKLQTVDDVKVEEPKPPVATDFTVKADFLAAQEKYELAKVDWDAGNILVKKVKRAKKKK